jgi:2-oxoglutarate ferredoxin oxidoreductase subunit alpha
MADFASLGFDLAFKYRNPVLVLSDGAIGQMMEKVELQEQRPRWTEAEIIKNTPWATTGKTKDRERNIITSLDLDSLKMEQHNVDLQAKYKVIEKNETRYEAINCDDADYLIVAYGTSARLSQKAVNLLRAEGIKVGLLRPITLFPFPSAIIAELANKVKGILTVEMSAGQMIEDVKLVVESRAKVEHFGRYGGVIHSPEEVLEALEQKLIGG